MQTHDHTTPLHVLAPDGHPSCQAPQPQAFAGLTWMLPPTAWEHYAADRALGRRVPPSVSTWRPQDQERQRLAEQRIRQGVPQRVTSAPWEVE